MNKRLFSLLLALVLCLSLAPMAALAEGSAEPEQMAAEKVQALIDALPDADTVTVENRAEVEAQLTAIDEAKLALGDEERDALDCKKYNDAIVALNVLDDMAGAEIPETLDTEPEHASHCVCGATHSTIGDHTSATTLDGWTAVSTQSEIGSSGNYYLTDDVTLTSQWKIANGSTITLCLNGHTLTADNASVADTILIEGTLNITDCKTTGKITGTNTTSTGNLKVLVVSAVYSDCTLNLYGGTITGINVGTGTGGGVHNEGTFNMYGGTISGNTAKNGGGVGNYNNTGYAGPAVFNFYGGTICGNTASDNAGGGGGGVFNTEGTFTMYGGIITGNTATAQPAGNGVHNWNGGTMNANGGTVEDKVYNQHGTITTTSTASTTTFKDTVTNGDSTHESTISAGIYNANVTNNGTINDSAKVTVSFCGDGWTGTQKILKGQKASEPTRDGYTCTGCYEDSDCITAFDFDTAITADITLYAKWVCAGHTGGTATCRAKAKCEACGEEYGDIDAANHTALNHVEPKAATAEAEGNIEYWRCGDCGKCFSDKGGENEIALADTAIAKLAPTAKAQAPNTGDEANVALWLVLATVSVFGVAVVGRKKVK